MILIIPDGVFSFKWSFKLEIVYLVSYVIYCFTL